MVGGLMLEGGRGCELGDIGRECCWLRQGKALGEQGGRACFWWGSIVCERGIRRA